MQASSRHVHTLALLALVGAHIHLYLCQATCSDAVVVLLQHFFSILDAVPSFLQLLLEALVGVHYIIRVLSDVFASVVRLNQF